MNNSKFKKIEDGETKEELLGIVNKQSFFWGKNWQSSVKDSFPYINFEYYLYDNAFFVILARINKNKIIGNPFCDLGVVAPLQKGVIELDIDNFFSDCKSFFGNDVKLSVNSFHCLTKAVDREVGLVDFVLDATSMSSTDEVMRSFKKNLRNVINKNPDFEIIGEVKPNQVKSLYKLYLQTMKRNQNLVIPFNLFNNIIKSRQAQVVLGEKDEKIIGFSIFLDYDDISHYFLNASDVNYRKYSVSHHLLWYKIRKNFKNGTKIMELGGTNTSSPLMTFKKSWNAQAYPIYQTGSLNKNIKKSRLRSIYGFLPTFVLERVSKFLWPRIL